MPCAPRPRRTLHDCQGRRVVPVDYPLSLLGAPASPFGDVQDGTEGVSHDHGLDVAHQLRLCRAEGAKWLLTRFALDEGTTVESQNSLVALLSLRRKRDVPRTFPAASSISRKEDPLLPLGLPGSAHRPVPNPSCRTGIGYHVLPRLHDFQRTPGDMLRHPGDPECHIRPGAGSTPWRA